MKQFTMKQLEQKTGLSRRTIRFYVAQGLLDAPEGKGRGSYYTKEHLKRLREIVSFRDQGLTLEQIRSGETPLGQLLIKGMEEALAYSRGEIELKTHTVTMERPSPGETWDHHWLTENVQVLIRRGLKPKAHRRIAKALKSLASTLEEG